MAAQNVEIWITWGFGLTMSWLIPDTTLPQWIPCKVEGVMPLSPRTSVKVRIGRSRASTTQTRQFGEVITLFCLKGAALCTKLWDGWKRWQVCINLPYDYRTHDSVARRGGEWAVQVLIWFNLNLKIMMNFKFKSAHSGPSGSTRKSCDRPESGWPAIPAKAGTSCLHQFSIYNIVIMTRKEVTQTVFNQFWLLFLDSLKVHKLCNAI